MSVEAERLPAGGGPMRQRAAERMARLGTETAFEVLAAARALEAMGQSIVHLEIGEPDFDTPVHISEAAVAALRGGATHYGPAAGLAEVRKVIAEFAGRERGIEVDPAHVVITPGAKPIMFFTIMALIQRGDEVIYPNPGFPIYESVINFCGGAPIPVALHEHLDFRFDVNELAGKITERTRLIILNSPQNPTGGVLELSDLEAIAALVRGRDIMVLSDEIYGRIIYEGEQHSISAQPGMLPHCIVLDGFSKTYAMTGWRLGYGIMPEWLAGHVIRLMTNSASCTASFTQLAGVAALQGPQDDVDRMVEAFRRRRDLIVDGLNAIPGITCRRPKGAFYVFPSIAGTALSARVFADRLLKEEGVAALAGTSFGQHGEHHLRLSYATSEENIREALRRVSSFVQRLAVDG